MTRDEAIEAGARALAQHTAWATTGPDDCGQWDVICHDCGWWLGLRAEILAGAEPGDTRPFFDALAIHQAQAVLDAIGWVEPAAYVIGYDDRTPPSMVFQGVTDLPAAREWADPGERVWGLVPVEDVR